MSPINHHATGQLRQMVYYNLDCNLVQNALFLAGRLHAYEPRASEAAYLVALCHLRLNQFRAAYDYSKNYGSRATHLGCAYVFAQACLGLGRHAEGITALEKSRMHWIARNNWGKHTETKRQHLPDAAAVLCLLGKLLQAHNEEDRATECYAEALNLNPFMWDAFTALCEMGTNLRIPNIFKMTPEMAGNLAMGGSEELSSSTADESLQSSLSQSFGNDPFGIASFKINGDTRQNATKSALYEKLNGSTNLVTPVASFNNSGAMETPSGPGTVAAAVPRIREPAAMTLDESSTMEPPHAPARKARAIGGLGMETSDHAPPKMKGSTLRPRSRMDRDQEEMEGAASGIISTLGSGINDRKRTVSGHASQAASTAPLKDSAQNPPDPMAPQRRSVRILNSITKPQGKFSSTGSSAVNRDTRELKKAKATGTRGRANPSTVGRVVSGNRKNEPMDIDAKETKQNNVHSHPPPAPPKPHNNEKAREIESLQVLLDLFARLGSGYLALSHYRCEDALHIFNSISPPQRETPWVLAQIARAYFEQRSWAEAEKFYLRVRAIAPSRLEDLDLYSTALWQLKKDVELSFLAHELIDSNRLSPQAWCAVGNSFALQRDHEQALKCFKRATQLDPKFAYAFTLQGHEHISSEEYDKALGAFRNAIAVEHRHYNAWYGLGRVFEKQGKYDIAEQHYRIALAINPNHSVLLSCVGFVLEKMKKPQQALDQYTRASELEPKSTLARFRKARLLFGLRHPELALGELLVVKDMAPDDADTHFLLGKVYKALKQKGKALKYFTIALSLDPKASDHIKQAMEQMNDEIDEDEPMT